MRKGVCLFACVPVTLVAPVQVKDRNLQQLAQWAALRHAQLAVLAEGVPVYCPCGAFHAAANMPLHSPTKAAATEVAWAVLAAAFTDVCASRYRAFSDIMGFNFTGALDVVVQLSKLNAWALP